MIELRQIDVTFDGTRVIGGLNLSIVDGEFFTLLGPSGCGKTTLLRTISGFVVPSAGHVLVDAQNVTRVPPEDRGIGVVFQNYALFPHLSVFENVAFGLRIARVTRAELRDKVMRSLERIGMADHGQKKPAELSGGQQQRVAIARALILGTNVLLFDEPLSNLDAKLREEMRDEIRDIQQRLGLTVVYVTHDQNEALAISDRIAVMRDGAIQQIGDPRDLYDAPKSAFVCTFVGETSQIPPSKVGGRVAFVRPEHVSFGPALPSDIAFQATLVRTIFQGARQRLVLRTEEMRILADVPSTDPVAAAGETLNVRVDRGKVQVFAGSAT